MIPRSFKTGSFLLKINDKSIGSSAFHSSTPARSYRAKSLSRSPTKSVIMKLLRSLPAVGPSVQLLEMRMFLY